MEEIKKEIEPLLVLDDVLYCKDCGSRNIKKSYKPYKIGESIMKILDKYKNQETFLNERIDTLKDTQLKQLNKISDLEKYKNAWEELKEEIMKKEKLYDRCIEALFLPNESNKSLELKRNYGKGFHFGSKLTNGYIDKIMQELEQKYNIGGE
jgi:hypothetical protein